MGCALTDEYGSESGIALEMMLSSSVKLEFDLRQENGAGETAQLPVLPRENLSFSGAYFALDTKIGASLSPKLLCTSGITCFSDAAGHTILSVEIPGTGTPEILGAMAGKESLTFCGELGGLDADGATIFAWQFPVTVRGRVYLGSGGTATVAGDPDYYTAAQVEAVLGRQLVLEYSADGTSWHASLQSTDLYQRIRHGAAGVPSAAQAIPYGPAGADGEPVLPVRTLLTQGGTVTLADNTEYRSPAGGIREQTILFPETPFQSFLELELSGGSITPAITFPASARFIGAVPAMNAGETWAFQVKNGFIFGGKTAE